MAFAQESLLLINAVRLSASASSSVESYVPQQSVPQTEKLFVAQTTKYVTNKANTNRSLIQRRALAIRAHVDVQCQTR